MHAPPSTLVAKIIAAQFPALGVRRVAPLGEGYDNWAFEVNGQWVFRFPQRDDVERQIEGESRLLTALAQRSPIPLPTNQLRGRPSPDFPRAFVGYPKLEGHPAIGIDPCDESWSGLAQAIGGFLSWLHSYPTADALRFGLEASSIAKAAEDCRSESLEDVDVVERVSGDGALDQRSRAALEAGVDLIPTTPPVVLHHDLAGEHVLIDSGARQVTGVIDWTDAAIGDRSADFAGLYHWGGPGFVERVVAHYGGPIDETTLARAQFLSVCRGVGDVVFGVRRHRPEYVAAGLRALRMCA
jgi:aminoglycoside 2''-phosphotransferase